MTVKSTNIKNQTLLFCLRTWLIYNLKSFDSSLLKLDKKLYKNIGIYYIGYTTIKKIDDYENIYSVNHLYLIHSYQVDILNEKGK